MSDHIKPEQEVSLQSDFKPAGRNFPSGGKLGDDEGPVGVRHQIIVPNADVQTLTQANVNTAYAKAIGSSPTPR